MSKPRLRIHWMSDLRQAHAEPEPHSRHRRAQDLRYLRISWKLHCLVPGRALLWTRRNTTKAWWLSWTEDHDQSASSGPGDFDSPA